MKNLQEDIDRTKDLINIVNLSDLQDSGTWSPITMTKLKDGALKYYYVDGKFTTKHPEGSKNYELFYLKPGAADFLNKHIELTRQKKREYQHQLDLTNEAMRGLIGSRIPI